MNWLWTNCKPACRPGQTTRARLSAEGLGDRIVPSAVRATEAPTGTEPAVVHTLAASSPAVVAARDGVAVVGDLAAGERVGAPSIPSGPDEDMRPAPDEDDGHDKPPQGPGVGPGPVSISEESARAPGAIGGPAVEGLVATSVTEQVQSQLPGYGTGGFWDTVCEGVFGAAGAAAGGAIGGAVGGPPGAAYGAGAGGIIGAGIGSEVCEDLLADNGSPGGGGGTEGAGPNGGGMDGAGGSGGEGGDQQFDYGDEGDDPGSDDGGYCPEDGESSSDDDDDDDDDNESSEPTDEGFPADDDSGGGGPKGINTIDAVDTIGALFRVEVTPAVNGQQWTGP